MNTGPVFDWADLERRRLVSNKRRTEWQEGRLEALTEVCQRLRQYGEAPEEPKRQEGGKEARGECFLAMLEVCGWDRNALTASARGRVNKALKELRDADPALRPEKLMHAAAEWKRMHPKIAVSPQVLTCHWPVLTKRFVSRAGILDRKAEAAMDRLGNIDEVTP